MTARFLLDPDDDPFDDRAFLRAAALGEGLFEHLREIFARRPGGLGGSGHELSSVAVGGLAAVLWICRLAFRPQGSKRPAEKRPPRNGSPAR